MKKSTKQNKEYNLTGNQLRVWSGQNKWPNLPVYNNPVLFLIKGNIEVKSFQLAFQKLINSCDVLRTIMNDRHGITKQVVKNKSSYSLEFVDYSNKQSPKKWLNKWVSKHSKIKIDLHKWLFESALIKINQGEYAWYLNPHQIIIDEHSIHLLFQQLSAFYQQIKNSQPLNGIDIPQFEDYIQREGEVKTSKKYLNSNEYYHQKLNIDGKPIKFYGKLPNYSSTYSKEMVIDLTPERVSSIKEISSTEDFYTITSDLTLHCIFTTLIFTYLYRITGNTHLKIGISIHNRIGKKLKNTIGPFKQVLPLQVSFNENETFFSLYQKIRQEVLLLLRYRSFQIENSSHTQIYDVVINYHHEALLKLDGVPVNLEWLDSGHCVAPMTINVHRHTSSSEELIVKVNFNQKLFSAQQREYAVGHLMNIIDAFIEDPRCDIGEFCLLSPAERHKVLFEFNQTERRYPSNTTIHQLFEQQVEKTPNNIAVVFEDHKLTYRELNNRANQIAHYLREQGVGPEVLVGICMERSIEMIVAIFGVLKAGGAYLPLDPTYPRQRIAFMMEDAELRLLLTQKHLSRTINKFQGKLILIDSNWEKIYKESKENLSYAATSDNLAYVIYTSGSTGKPKGVMIEHRGIVNRLLWMQESYQLNPMDNVMQKTPFSFDVSIWEFFWPLLEGASLIISKPEGHKDNDYLVDLIYSKNITIIHFVPPMLKFFLENEKVKKCHSLKKVFCSGEELPVELKNRFYECLSAELHNLYGPTEASIDVTHWFCSTNKHSEKIPIGKPIANIQIFILNQYLNPVPIGVPGELHIGGIGLARGYLNSPELTKEKFILNPFTQKAKDRLYKTGDLAVYLPDGNIEFLGRIDHQVKIRGFRIELGEIEYALSQHPNIRDSVVIAQEDNDGQKRLISYIVPNSPSTINKNELRNFLKENLPDYMIPSVFMELNELPLKSNGKIDRQALPIPKISRAEYDETYVPPRNSTERSLVKIWENVLNIDKIGLNDNFFELGGDSLRATQIIIRLRKNLNINLSIKSFFENSTISDLASLFEKMRLREADVEISKIQTASKNLKNIPLSFNQRQMWIMKQIEPDSPKYNEAVTIRIHGTLNLKILEKSLREIINRHESLRTIFKTVNGEPIQVVAPNCRLKLHTINLSHYQKTMREAKAIQIATEEAKVNFELDHGPLLRATLVILEEKEHWLFLTFHHIVADGVSIYKILFSELSILYDAFEKNNPSPLKKLPIQYTDFAIWQSQYLKNKSIEYQLAFWDKKLSNLPVIQLPTDYSKPKITSKGAKLYFKLPIQLCESIKDLSRETGVTLFTTFLTACKILLYRYTGQEDIPVGTVSAGRKQLETENLVGYFLNTLIIRTTLSKDETFRQLSTKVQNLIMEAESNSDVPFEKVVQKIDPERKSNLDNIIQTMFVLETPLKKINKTWELSQLDVDTDTAKFNLTFELDERSDGIYGRVEYRTDLFESRTIAQMIRHYFVILENVVANADRTISGIPILTEEERYVILEKWNGTYHEYPEDKCIHHLFEEQVELNPDNIAVVFEDQKLTYRELNNRANQLAHYLREQGVGPEVLVGICMERSIEMIVGILGILKVGGAYVPINPEDPMERLKFILSDTKVAVILTKEKHQRIFFHSDNSIIYVDSNLKTMTRMNNDNPNSFVKPENLAYVLYTSGTTGKPKGVMIEHRNILALLYGFEKVAPLNKTLIGTSVCPINFDVSNWEIFSNICFGGTLHILNPEIYSFPDSFVQYISEQQITSVYIPPALLNGVASKLEYLDCQIDLDRILVGVEPIKQGVLQRFRDFSDKLFIINGYGPTEATICSTFFNFLSTTNPERRTPIGTPVPGYKVFLFNDHLQLVPIGVPGELHIAGAGLARGYHNRPELTKEKFIPNPFSNKPGDRLYKTGDLGRYLPDGNIEFLGRIDHQVKIRGFRVEPGEIESVLSRHESVKETVVIAYEDDDDQKQLVAYVVPKQKNSIDMSELRKFLKEKLASYMIPSFIMVLNELPVTPNGKIDRKRLPKPRVSREEFNKFYIPPRNSMEKSLVKIWKEVLKINKIGIHDNFFELGGDSILSIQVVAKAKKAGILFTPKSLFQHQTISELANVAQNDSGISTSQKMIQGSVPLTPIQHWFFEQKLAEPNHFNQSFFVDARDKIDVHKLEKVLTKLVWHHDTLRVRYSKKNNGWHQKIIGLDRTKKILVKQIDLSQYSVTEQKKIFNEKIFKLQTRLDIQKGPIIKVAIFNYGNNRPHKLLFIIHHLAVDGVSWRIFFEDLQTAYYQLKMGKQINLPPKTTSFKYWAENLLKYAQTDEAEKEVDYWISLKEHPFYNLPTDFNKGPNVRTSTHVISAELTKNDTEFLLKDVLRSFQCQINDVLLSALMIAIQSWTGFHSIFIDVESHGREEVMKDVDLSRTVGWFTVTYPIRLELHENSNIIESVEQIKEQIGGIPNQGIGYGLLRYVNNKRNIREKMSSIPHPEISFNYLGQFDQVFSETSIFSISKQAPLNEQNPRTIRQHLIEFEGAILGGELQFNIVFSKNFHRKSTIEKFANHFENILKDIIQKSKISKGKNYLPSDFPLAHLNEEQLSEIEDLIDEVDNSDNIGR